jgi:phage regulator Rha-like protein
VDIDDRQVLDLAKFGGVGKTTLVNETGLYLLMMANAWKEVGEKFRKWVISEALPSMDAEEPQSPEQEPEAEAVVSSYDLATAISRKHGNLKRTVERLAAKGKISGPPTSYQTTIDAHKRSRLHSVYLLSHRDASYVAAHLDPACTRMSLPNAKPAPASDPAPVAAQPPAADEQVIEDTPPAPAPAPSLFDHAQSKALPSVTGSEPTMTSQEIADLVKSRHDKVKQSIDRLVERGVIAVPPMGETPTPGGGKPKMVYHLRQRESYIVVAQLSPEFTAELVDRWRELEAQVATPPEPGPAATSLPNFTDPADAARAWASEYEKREAAETRALSVGEELDRFAKAKGLETITSAAKMLKVLPGYLFELMRKEKWIYRKGFKGRWQAYQDKIETGLLDHVGTKIPLQDGSTKMDNQVRVTAKGIVKLAKIINDSESARQQDVGVLNGVNGARAQ